MGWMTKGLSAVAVAGGVVVAARRLRAARRPQEPRWHAVTVFRPIGEVAPGGRPPAALEALDDLAEIVVRRAPGDRGTEIAVRPHDDRDTPQVRRALRELRAVLEIGEVPAPDRPPTTRRTVWNRPLAAVTRRGREGGLL